MLGWKVCCSVFWGNMNKTRYSATEFGGNKPMNFRPSGTLNIRESFHVEWLNPELNKQVEHVNLSLHF